MPTHDGHYRVNPLLSFSLSKLKPLATGGTVSARCNNFEMSLRFELLTVQGRVFCCCCWWRVEKRRRRRKRRKKKKRRRRGGRACKYSGNKGGLVIERQQRRDFAGLFGGRTEERVPPGPGGGTGEGDRCGIPGGGERQTERGKRR